MMAGEMIEKIDAEEEAESAAQQQKLWDAGLLHTIEVDVPSEQVSTKKEQLQKQIQLLAAEKSTSSEKPPSGQDFDPVNRPKHYNSHPSGIQCIEVTRHMSFNIGNVIKYCWRTEHKNGIEDLKKARWYLDDEIARLEKLALDG